VVSEVVKDDLHSTPVHGIAALKASANEGEVGHCDLCKQEMIRTPNDCWHPVGTVFPCPPEPAYEGNEREYLAWLDAGNVSRRPGREHFVPGPASPEDVVQLALAAAHKRAREAGVVSNVVEAFLEVRSADGSLTRIRFTPEDGQSLKVEVEATGHTPQGLRASHELVRSGEVRIDHEVRIRGAELVEHEHLVRQSSTTL